MVFLLFLQVPAMDKSRYCHPSGSFHGFISTVYHFLFLTSAGFLPVIAIGSLIEPALLLHHLDQFRKIGLGGIFVISKRHSRFVGQFFGHLIRKICRLFEIPVAIGISRGLPAQPEKILVGVNVFNIKTSIDGRIPASQINLLRLPDSTPRA